MRPQKPNPIKVKAARLLDYEDAELLAEAEAALNAIGPNAWGIGGQTPGDVLDYLRSRPDTLRNALDFLARWGRRGNGAMSTYTLKHLASRALALLAPPGTDTYMSHGGLVCACLLTGAPVDARIGRTYLASPPLKALRREQEAARDAEEVLRWQRHVTLGFEVQASEKKRETPEKKRETPEKSPF